MLAGRLANWVAASLVELKPIQQNNGGLKCDESRIETAECVMCPGVGGSGVEFRTKLEKEH